MSAVLGKGSFEQPLDDTQVREICAAALSRIFLDGKRVLVLIPDHTRHAKVGLFFRIVCDLLLSRTAALDFLIATGTHAPMEPERIYRHLGITAEDHREKYSRVRFFNHEHWNLPELVTIGRLPAEEILRLTNGVFSTPIDVTINRKAVEYDHILLITPVVPHEAMGFAGGNKYFFPGIAGLEVVETFHWLAATITNTAVNGVKDTLTRRVIDRAVEFLATPRDCLAYAVNDQNQPMCLFVGEPREAWSRAADYSAKLHIKYVEKPYRTILAITPPMYEELWVGGKAMYKLEPIVADGGELIIFGPQIREFSFVHGPLIQRLGYHVLEYFTKQWDRFSREPKLILAHSTNVRGDGSFEAGVERPRIKVTLASAIPEESCLGVNLGFRDHQSINLDAWRQKQNGDVLVVENAGQVLYRLAGAS